MPIHWLTEAERNRFQNFPADVSEADRTAFFTLSDDDRRLVESKHGDQNRLGCALLVCTLRWLGFVPDNLGRAPLTVLVYLARQLNVENAISDRYGRRERTRRDHFAEVAAHLGFRRATPDDWRIFRDWLGDRALEHDRPLTLMSLLCERLFSLKVIRPGITRLERLTAVARRDAEQRTWRDTRALMTDELKTRLDALLDTDTQVRQTQLTWLRTGAVSATPSAILDSLKKIRLLREFGVDGWSMDAFHPNRLKFLAQLGRKTTAHSLRRMPPERRYPILVGFLHQSLRETIDETLDLYDRCLWEAHARAGRELEVLRKAAARTTNETVRLFQVLGRIVLDPNITDAEVRRAVYRLIPAERLRIAVKECADIERPPDDSHFDLLNLRYGYLRQFTPRFLNTFDWQNAGAGESLTVALQTLNRMWEEGHRNLPDDAPRGFIPEKWTAHVINESGAINRRYYELCALWELRGALRAGNVWVAGSRRYADPSGFLIPPCHWDSLRTEACRMLDAPVDFGPRLEVRIKEIQAAAMDLDKLLGGQGPVSLDDEDRLVLSPFEAEARSPDAQTLERLVSERLPQVDLPALLIEVDGWVGFSRRLTHAGNNSCCKKDDLPLLYGALLSQSGNFGSARMAQMSDFSPHQLAWTTAWHLREDTLREAVNELVDFHHRLPLTRHWGGGTLSSSDGQRFPVAVKSLTATPLPRYFGHGRGVTFYTWTSDQHSQYGTKVIPATMRDATVVLDEILDNETDLPIATHTTDTAGYTELVFALFDLLGLQFAPRIRDLGSQKLYRIGDVAGNRVRPLLKGKINTDLIVKHWDELLRLAGSLKLGWTTSSLLLTRMHAAPRQNSLVKALQEYGRLAKTLFILRYLGSEDLRRRIHGQLNKGEALHSLRRYLFAANEGHVRKPYPDDQLNQATCLTLVTNAVIVWNTVYMSAVLEHMRKDGYVGDEALMQYLSPTRFEHINVFGKYSFPVAEELGRIGLRQLRDPSKDILAGL
jgi:TnpA family transposase